MFFFTRRGYINEIKRLQLALNDTQESLLKAHESHQRQENLLLDRLTSLLDPGALREARKGLRDQSDEVTVVPQMLNRPKPKRRVLHNPGTKTIYPKFVDFGSHSEQDKQDVEATMNASAEEAN
jgi:hypothetical protein